MVEGSSKKEKRTHGHGQHCGDLVIARGNRWVGVEEGIRGINGNVKNTIKINY